MTELRRGQTLRFNGRVLDQPNGGALPFDGVASLLIEDSAPTDNTGRSPAADCFSFYYDADYRYEGAPLPKLTRCRETENK